MLIIGSFLKHFKYKARQRRGIMEEWSRRNKLMMRWSIVSASSIAFFWLIWHFFVGEVPTVTSIKMSPDWTYILPFGISRWWDALIGPIWSIIIILLLTNKRVTKDKDLIVGLSSGLVVGLGVGLVVGLGSGLSFGLVVGLVVGLVFGLGVGLVVGLGSGLSFGLSFGLVVGLVVGLGSGLGFGLTFGLAYGLGFGLTFGLAYGLTFGLALRLGFGLKMFFKLITKAQFWFKIRDWLLVRDTAPEKD